MFLENHPFHNKYYTKKKKPPAIGKRFKITLKTSKRFVCINQFLVAPQHISQAGLLTWLSAFHFAFPIFHQWHTFTWK